MKKYYFGIWLIIILVHILFSSATQAQNVGIGETNPTSRLEVKGETDDATKSLLNLKSLSGTSRFFVRNDGLVRIPGLSGIGTRMMNVQSDGTLGFLPAGTAGQYLRYDGTWANLIASDIPNLDASKITTGVFAPARLGTGTPSTTTFLRGDGTWQPAPGDNLGNHTATTTLNMASNIINSASRIGINTTSGGLGMLEINSNLVNGISGWNRNIYFNNTNHSSITTNGLLFGMHDANKAFYFGDITGTTLNKYVMTIFANTGNVGIGNTAPGARLDVSGNTWVRGNSANATFTNGGHLALKATANPFISWHHDDGTRIGYLQFIGTTADGGGTIIGSGSLRATALSGTGSRVLVADPIGNITAVPYSTVGDHLGNHTATTTLDMNSQNIARVGRTITAINAAGTPETFLHPRWTDDVTYLNFGAAGFNIRNNAGVTRMFITDAGNVGIGTASPTHQLHTTGQIRAGAAGIGYSVLSGGSSTNAGFLEIRQPSNTRVGYIGWDAANMNYVAEVGVHRFNTHINNQYANGYIFTTYLNQSSPLEDPNSYTVQGFPFFSSDGYMRKASAAAIRSALGITAPTGDNLGNHTATTTLNMNARSISNYAYLKPYGEGVNSGLSHQYYSIYQEGGAWAHPYPDLNINYHTGIKINAYYGYDGIRFYTGAAPATGLAFQIGEASTDHIMGYRYLRLSSGNWFGVAGSAGIYNYQHGQHFYTTNNSAYWISRSGSGMLFQNASAATMGYVYHDGTNFGLLDAGGSWTVRTNTGVVAIHKNMQVNGNVSITGTMNSTGYKETSDARWKKNVSPIANALGKVMAMRGVNYDFKTKEELLADKQDTTYQFSDRRQIGFIAQEVEKVLPEVVSTDPVGYKTVEYSKVVALLVEAMKEQQKQIETLKAENASLKAQAEKVQQLEAKMAKLEQMMNTLQDMNNAQVKK